MKLTQVRFIKHFDKYSPKDVAGFSEDQAKRLIDSAIATDLGAEVEVDKPIPVEGSDGEPQELKRTRTQKPK